MRIGHKVLGAAAATFDKAVVRAMQMRNRKVRARAEAMSHDERLERLEQIRAIYDRADPDEYFPRPPACEPRIRRVRALEGGEVIDLKWPSGYDPFDDGVRASYLAHERNHHAYARVYAAKTPRPAVILVHGYLAGQWALEERAWPLAWMHKRGLDVAIALLPFHALRGRPDGGAPPFPGADPRFTNEGFRQAIGDLRALAQWLRGRGAPHVGVMGMSLGGYTTSLLATVEPELAFAAPIIPLASIADFAREQGRLGDGERAATQHAALERANRVVSPLARPPRLSPDRVLVIGAEADRITPIAHAERIAAHFRAPLVRLHGGHLLQFGRAEAFREIRRMLQRLEIIR